jgi:hypothetical protein
MRPDGYNILTSKRVDFGALICIMSGGIDRRTDFFEIGGAEVLFETYRWMTSSVTTATGYPCDRWSWPTTWVRESLAADMSDRHSCGMAEITPIRGSAYPNDRHQDAAPPWGWRRTLARRFHAALFDDGLMAEWRKAMRIDPAKPRRIGMLVYDRLPPPPWATHYFDGKPVGWRMSYGDPAEGRGFEGEIDRLFALATPTRRLIPQLNRFHADARFLTDVNLTPTHAGCIVSTGYGVDGSRWNGPECAQKKGEPFANFIYRAYSKIDAMLTPACKPVRTCRPVARAGIEQIIKRHDGDFGTFCARGVY